MLSTRARWTSSPFHAWRTSVLGSCCWGTTVGSRAGGSEHLRRLDRGPGSVARDGDPGGVPVGVPRTYWLQACRRRCRIREFIPRTAGHKSLRLLDGWGYIARDQTRDPQADSTATGRISRLRFEQSLPVQFVTLYLFQEIGKFLRYEY